ncbi:MAG: malto-oligosyltrehalose synthase, partial [Alphaproteobacteria bacterium]|nr:malto-oligosyltrehalose synthase [Alphaproteobacteria bacterium]
GVAEFHRRMADRQRHWRHSLLATATHDTKRGEDARARINVLSEIPELWARRVARWRRLNRGLRSKVGGETAPSPNDEYLIYQTLLGAWPNVLIDGGQKELGERLAAYIVKATREAKWRTSWREPHQDYEEVCQRFIAQLLAAAEAEPFRQDFVAFHALVSRLGALNSLCQTVLKLTVPGVPDIYQGCELWDLSLVDPDNRRPVDFAARQKALDELAMAARDAGPGLLHELAAAWPTGKIKLQVAAALLAARRAAPQLFADGSYEPLAVRGPAAAHVLAFARRSGRQTMIVAVGRLFARLAPAADRLAPAVEAWGATSIAAPTGIKAGVFRNLLTGAVTPPPLRGRFLAADLFRAIPAAVLLAET